MKKMARKTYLLKNGLTFPYTITFSCSERDCLVHKKREGNSYWTFVLLIVVYYREWWFTAFVLLPCILSYLSVSHNMFPIVRILGHCLWWIDFSAGCIPTSDVALFCILLRVEALPSCIILHCMGVEPPPSCIILPRGGGPLLAKGLSWDRPPAGEIAR